MASNVIQRSVPYIWSSANDDIIFEFDFSPFAIDSITDNSGFAKITLLSGNFDPLPIPGEKIFIDSGIYNGTHTIRSVINDTTIVLFTEFIGTVTSNAHIVYHLRIPVFNFYKGFTDVEFAPDDLPFELVVPIVPSIIYDGNVIPYISINVKAITSRMFKPQPFTPTDTIPANIDFNIFNVIRFRWDDQETVMLNGEGYARVLYSAITNYELRLEYLQNGKYLVPTDKPIIPTSGAAFFSYLEIRISGALVLNPGYPVVHKFVDGVRV